MRRCAYRGTSRALLPVFCLLSLWGCASVDQVQYFEVIGPPNLLTGKAPKSYYRITIHGAGSGGVKYKMRAAYVSATTLDLMNGKLPNLPDADRPEANRKAFDEIKNDYLTALTSYAKRKRAADDTEMNNRRHNENLIEIAEQARLASLSDPDWISVGQTKSTDPYRFRKLVFYASATNLNLTEYDSQINSVLDKTSTLVSALKESRAKRQQARKTEHQRKRKAILTLFPNNATATAIVDFLCPEQTDDSTDKPTTQPSGNGD